ncbi:DUF3558 domain-containing protein [Nocardia camponoti]|uniref:DUF3558 domain-containing protein n=1 Tax=Nocardia camponoti TaxID=1616106 RepID=UPI00166C6D5A|nr:DUF3558 domain-containing protein [Nocardia camponoti]
MKKNALRGRRSALLVGPALVACAVGACSTTPTDSPPTPATTVAAKADFDPCSDLPAAYLQREGLKRLGEPESLDNGTLKTHGCAYISHGGLGYDVRIVRTTTTLDQIRAKFPDSYREEQFSGRRGAFYSLFPRQQDRGESCVVNVETRNGSLEFDLSNSKSTETGNIDSCALVRNIVTGVLPYVPAEA